MKYAKIRKVKSPVRGTKESAGIDFFVPDDFKTQTLDPGNHVLIPSGIKVNIPPGFALIGFNKSGIAVKRRLIIGACVIDEDYQGEMHIHLSNVGNENAVIEPGDKIAQFILVPVFYDQLEEVDADVLYTSISKRGEGGFGSTDNES